MIKIIIPGRAVPYVRTTQKQKYTSKSYARYRDYKQLVQIYARKQFKGSYDGSRVSIGVNVYLHGQGMFNMGGEGDIDNYIKVALDSLNGVLYKDDRQVMKITDSEKMPCDEDSERMEITIESMEDEDENTSSM